MAGGQSLQGGGGGGGGKRGTVHCLIPLCPSPHSPRGFAVAQNFTKRDPTITPATQATTFMKKNASVAFYREIWWSNRETGRFDKKTWKLPAKPGELAGMTDHCTLTSWNTTCAITGLHTFMRYNIKS